MDPTKKKDQRTQLYVDEVYRLALQRPGVQHVLILNEAGHPIKTSMSRQGAFQNIWVYGDLREKFTDALTDMNISKTLQELKILRIRTVQHEIIIVPDGKITVIVIQKSPDASIVHN